MFLFDQNIQNDRNNSKVSYAAMLKKGIENKSAEVGNFSIYFYLKIKFLNVMYLEELN